MRRRDQMKSPAKRRKIPRAGPRDRGLIAFVPLTSAASAKAPSCAGLDRATLLRLPISPDAARLLGRSGRSVHFRAKVSRTGPRARQLRIEQAVDVDDEIAHLRIVDGLLRRSLPRLVGFGIVGVDAD